MNKTYKVIYNRTRCMYQVVSELAKGHTKSETPEMLKSLFNKHSGLTRGIVMAVLSMSLAMPVGVAVQAEDTTAADTNLSNLTDTGKGVITTEATTVVNTAINSKVGSLGSNGNYIQKDASVSSNLSTLDTQVKTNADAISKETTDREAAVTSVTNSVSSLSDSAVQYDTGSNKGTVTLAGEGGTTITNVKDGALSDSSTDAVTGKQLYAEQTAREALITKIGTLDADGSYSYIQKDGSVSSNLSTLDTQVKANADAISKEKTDREAAVTNEQTAREAKDTELSNKITSNATDIKGLKDLSNVSEAGKTVIKKQAKQAVKVAADGNATVTTSGSEDDGNTLTYTIHISSDGTVSLNNTRLISGGTLYSELRPEDGTYVKRDNTTAANLSALDNNLSNVINAMGLDINDTKTSYTSKLNKYFKVNPEVTTSAGGKTYAADAAANGTNSVAIGPNAKTAKYTTTTTSGDTTTTTETAADHAVAIGDGATVNAAGDKGIALGNGAVTGEAETNSTDGTSTTTTDAKGGESSVAIGDTAKANGNQALAFGKGASVLNPVGAAVSTGSTAIGSGAKVDGGSNSIALGTSAVVNTVSDAMALGDGATINKTATGSIAIGKAAVTGGADKPITLTNGTTGTLAAAGGVDSIAIGNGAVSEGNEALALGKGAKVTNAATGGDSAAAIVKTGSAAIGDGAEVTNSATSMAIGNGASITEGENTTVIGSGAEAAQTKQAFVAGYQASSDSSAESSVAIGDNASTHSARTTAIGYKAEAHNADSIAIGSEAKTDDNGGGIAIGNKTSVAQGGIAIGNATQASNISSLAIGNGAVANVNQSISIGYNAGVNTTEDYKERNGSLVAIGTSAGNNVKGMQNVAVGASAGSAVLSSNNIAIGTNAGYGIKNVTSETDTNPQNGYNISIGAGANYTEGNTNQNIVSSIAIGHNTHAVNRAVALGEGASAQGDSGMALGNSATSSGSGGIAIGNTASASAGNIALGAGAVATGTPTGAGKWTNSVAPSYYISVGGKGNASDNTITLRRISNVADGSADQDVVTVKQLQKVSDDLENTIKGIDTSQLKTYSATEIDNKIAEVNQNIQNSRIKYFSINAASQSTNSNNTGANGNGDADAMAIGPNAKASSVKALAIGNNVSASGTMSIAIGTASNPSTDTTTAETPHPTSSEGTSSVAIGTSAIAQTNDSIAIGTRAATYTANTTSTPVSTVGVQSVAIGFSAETRDDNAISIGTKSKANSADAVAIGDGAQALNTGAVVIGTSSIANGSDSVTIGKLNTNDGQAVLTTGNSNSITNSQGIQNAVNNSGVYGSSNKIQSVSSSNSSNAITDVYAVGNSNTLNQNGEKNVLSDVSVLGNKNTIENGTAGAYTQTVKQIAVVGSGNTVKGNTQVDATTWGTVQRDTILGYNNTVDATKQSTPVSNLQILGNDVQATLGNSVYLGTKSSFTASKSATAEALQLAKEQGDTEALASDEYKNAATEEAKNAIKQKYEAKYIHAANVAAMDKDGISAGVTNYDTDYTYGNDSSYTYAGSQATGVVTVGSKDATRRIQNVSAGLVGPNSTDAVNGSQLYALTRQIRFGGDNSSFGKTTAADDQNVVARGSNETIAITGGSDAVTSSTADGTTTYTVDSAKLTGNNIAVVADADKNALHVQLASNLKNLNTAQLGSGSGDSYKETIKLDGTGTNGGTLALKDASGANGVTIRTSGTAKTADVTGTETSRLLVNDKTVATTDDGLKFGGDTGTDSALKLNNKLTVKGGATTGLSDNNNIGVVSDGTTGTLTVKLNKDVNLGTDGSLTTGTVTAATVATGSSTLNTNGLTITNGPKFTSNDISANSQQIKNVLAGTDDTDAANYSQIKKATTTLTTGKNGNVNVTTNTTPTADGHTNYTIAVDNLAVKANGTGNTSVELARGINFKNGDHTTATVDADGTVTINATHNKLRTVSAATGDKDNVILILTDVDGNTVTSTGLKNTYTTVTKDGTAHTVTFARNDGTTENLSLGDLDGASKSELATAAAKATSEVTNGTNVTSVTKTTGNNNQNIYTVNVDDLAVKTTDGEKKSVHLKDGLVFADGTNTTATVGDNGTVKFNVSDNAIKKQAVNAINVTGGSNVTVTPETNADGTLKTFTVAASDLKYSANGTSKTTSLANGISFAAGSNTTAEIDNNGAIKINAIHNKLNATGTATKATADSNAVTLTLNDQDGNTTTTALTDTYTTVSKDATNKKVTFKRNDGETQTLELSDLGGITAAQDKYVTGGTVSYDANGNGTASLTGNNGLTASITGLKDTKVSSGTASYVDAHGKATMTGSATLTMNDGTTATISGLKDDYITSASVGTKNNHVTMTRLGGGTVDLDLNPILGKYSLSDYHLVGAGTTHDQAYAVDSNGTVTLNVVDDKNPNGTPKTIQITGLASQSGVNAGRTTVKSSDNSVTVSDSAANSDTHTYDIKVDYSKIPANLKVQYSGDNGTSGSNTMDKATAFSGTANQIVTTAADGKVSFKLADDISGIQSVTTGDAKLNTNGLTVTNGPTFTKSNIDANNQQIHKVLAGTENTDAANVSQVKAATTEVKAGTNTTIDAPTKDSTDNHQVYTVNVDNLALSQNDAKVGTGVALKNGLNFKDGTNTTASVTADGKVSFSISNDAIKAQAKNAVVLTAGDNVTIGTPTDVDNVKTYTVSVNDLKLQADGADKATRKLADGINFTGGTNTTADVTADGKVTYTLKDSISLTQVQTGNTTLNTTGVSNGDMSLTNTGFVIKNNDASKQVSVTTSGVSMGSQRIQNVADATQDTDAATLKQVKNARTVVAGGSNVAGVTPAEGANNQMTYTVNVDNLSVKANNEAAKSVTLKNGLIFNNGTNTTASVGDNGEVKYDLNSTLTGLTSVTAGNSTLDTNGLTIKDGAATKVEITSGNVTMGGNVIHNVGAGIDPTDAVNKGQLEALQNQVSGGWNLVGKNSDGTAVTAKIGAGKTVTYTDGTYTKSVITKDDTTGNAKVKVDVTTGKFGSGTGDKAGTVTSTANGLATTQDVATAVNNASWTIQDGNNTGNAQQVKAGDTVSLKAGDNLSLDQNGKKFTYKLNKTLENMTSVTAVDDKQNTAVLNGEGLKVSDKEGDSLTQHATEVRLHSATAATEDTSKDVVLNNAGLTVGNNVKFTNNGISAGDQKITGVADGEVQTGSKEAVNGGQLYELQQKVTNGWKITGNDTTKASNIGNDKTVSFVNGDNSYIKAKVDTTNTGATVSYTAQTASLMKNADGKAALNGMTDGLVTGTNLTNVLNSLSWTAQSSKVGSGQNSGSTSQSIAAGSKVSFIAGDNMILTQDGTNFTYALNSSLTGMNTIAFTGLGNGASNLTIGLQNGGGANSDKGYYITGLSNTKWDQSNYEGTRAATEAQLREAIDKVSAATGTGGFGLTADEGANNGGEKKVSQTLGRTIAIQGDGTYGADGTVVKQGNISTVAYTDNAGPTGAIKVKLNKDIDLSEAGSLTIGASKVSAGSIVLDNTGDAAKKIALNSTAGTASIGGVTVDGAAKTVMGLANTTWDGTAVRGRAATEDQLAKAISDVSEQATNSELHIRKGTYSVGKDKDGQDVADSKGKNSVSIDVVNAKGTVDGQVVINDVAKASELGAVGELAANLKNPAGGPTTVVQAVNNVNQKVDDSLKQVNGDITSAVTEAKKHTEVKSVDSDNNVTIDGTTTNAAGGTVYKLGLNKDHLNLGNVHIYGNEGRVTAKTVEAEMVKIDDQTRLDKTGLTTGNTMVANNRIVVGGDNGIKIEANGGQQTISGLTNTDWTGTAVHGRAATEDQLAKAISSATTTAAQNEQHVQAGTYDIQTTTDDKGNKQNKVTMKIVDGNGNDKGTVTINDVAKASNVGDTDKLAADIKNQNGGQPQTTSVVEAVNNLNEKVNNRVGDNKYSAITNKDPVQDGDSSTTAIGKLNNRMNDIYDKATQHASVSVDENLTMDDTKQNASGGTDYKIGLNKEQINLGNVTIKGNAGSIEAKSMKADSFTAGDTVVNKDGVKVGDKSALTGDSLKVGGKTYVDDKGINANGKAIGNVGEGKKDTDAVNVKQVNDLAARQGEAITENAAHIGELGRAVNKLGNRLNRVGAGAAALAALHPGTYDPNDKWDFSAGIGHYHDANAVAIGAYYHPNDTTILSIGGSMGGGENMVNAGITWKMGRSGHEQRAAQPVVTHPVQAAPAVQQAAPVRPAPVTTPAPVVTPAPVTTPVPVKAVVPAMPAPAVTTAMPAAPSGDTAALTQILARQTAILEKLAQNQSQAARPAAAHGDDIFPDVPNNHWAYAYVAKLEKAGALKGFKRPAVLKSPMMTRDDFASVLYTAMANGATTNPALNGDDSLNRLAQEFKAELKDVKP
ncbi:ESPR-type extended signal peptide-containing protein [Megasphaera elsdenii]|uniref:ESPR-type extended signal peptide-containing protein n=1 Tax=Megasphaera elsdenii TaxID=907 RepID=UPI0005146925|nr:ESPR-type extended signal peptide-containing protein [Megasphaera elsdenii]KGI89338.1 hypothetical protein JY94_06980 [Megasphaera elsdenii]